MTTRPRLRLVPLTDDSPASTAHERHRADVGFLALLVAVNAVPLVALAAGHFWGFAACGCSAVMTLLLARQLLHDVVERRRSRRNGAT